MAIDFSNDADIIDIVVPGETQVITIAVPGMQGPPGAVAVGNVATGAPGSSASVVVRNLGNGSQVVDFTIPRGDVGPANSLTIGSVTASAAGSSASASITGTAPSQTLSLVLPRGDTGPQGFKGDTGATGATNTLSIGTVSTGAAGSNAAATITGTAPNQTLSLTIPRGADPAPNSLAIGTVTTGAAGSSASATITGTAPSQTLNLTIPTGSQGPPGAGAPDATTLAKGSVRLSGDLAGTADSPTVPGLAGKANATHTHTATDISNSTAVGRSLITATDAATARSAIGAGTSDLIIGTTATTAMAGNKTFTASDVGAAPAAHTHTASNISDASTIGRTIVTAADAAAVRTAIGAGTGNSNLVIGTTAGTAAAGNDSRLSDARTPLAHTHGVTDLTATGTRDSTTFLRGDNTWAVVQTGTGSVSSANITDATAIGRTVLTSADAAAVRTAIGAGTSSLAIGTTGTTAAAGNDSRLSDARTPLAHTHLAANISDSTPTGRSVLMAVDAAAARTAIGAGTGSSNLVIGTTAGTAKDGAYQPTAANISDATATGRSVLTAIDAAAARTAIGAGTGTSNLVIGTTAGTAAAGNDSRLSDARTPTAHTHTAANISDSTTVGRAVLVAADAATARTAIGAGTGNSNLTIGTTNSTAKAGDYAPPVATEAVSGTIAVATTAEVTSGTIDTKAVTPLKLRAQLGSASINYVTTFQAALA